MRFLLTFGQVHAHRVAGQTFDKDSVAVIEASDEMEARQKAFIWFGDQWHQCLQEDEVAEDFMSHFPRGKIEVQAKPAPKIRNLGWVNGWPNGFTPEAVRKCRDAQDRGEKHDIITQTTGRCVTRTTCRTCGYTYQVDSGD